MANEKIYLNVPFAEKDAAKALGAKSGRLAIYQTSGDVTGDKTSVVGYAGIIIN